jgi:hypothetical protein
MDRSPSLQQIPALVVPRALNQFHGFGEGQRREDPLQGDTLGFGGWWFGTSAVAGREKKEKEKESQERLFRHRVILRVI